MHRQRLPTLAADLIYSVSPCMSRVTSGPETVSMLSVSVKRRNVRKARTLVEELDETAFITAEDLTPVRRGYWGM